MTQETRTYKLDEVVARVGVPSELWLRRKLNAGVLRGRRAGRIWSMTESDIVYLIDYMARGPKSNAANEIQHDPQVAPVTSMAAGMSARSRKRITSRSA